MREADVAIRIHRPTQPDLIQRRLITVHSHIYGSKAYLEVWPAQDGRGARPAPHGRLRRDPPPPAAHTGSYCRSRCGRAERPRYRRSSQKRLRHVPRRRTGLGIASLPDYLAGRATGWGGLCRTSMAVATAYFASPEELGPSKRVAVFRDFLLQKVAEQPVRRAGAPFGEVLWDRRITAMREFVLGKPGRRHESRGAARLLLWVVTWGRWVDTSASPTSLRTRCPGQGGN